MGIQTAPAASLLCARMILGEALGDELAYVRVPDSVTDLGQWAFDDCPRLYISVPSSLDGFDSNYDIEPMHIEQR